MAASGAGWLSQVGCMTTTARECVVAFPFGEEMSVSKLSDTTCTNPCFKSEIPCSDRSLAAATAADFLNRRSSS